MLEADARAVARLEEALLALPPGARPAVLAAVADLLAALSVEPPRRPLLTRGVASRDVPVLERLETVINHLRDSAEARSGQ